MTEAIVTPPPERAQHDEIAVRKADRKNRATVYVVPPYEIWHSRGMIDERQRNAAQLYCEDTETTGGKLRSSLASLDRVDYAAVGVVEAEAIGEARQRLADVERSLGPVLANIVRKVLIDRVEPAQATGKHKDLARGMIVAALEVMAVCYGLKGEKA